jgi:hypothetical protein
MKSEFGIRMSLYISISFKKWKSLYCSAVVVALKSSMCSCIRSTKKSMILGNRISFLAVVCAVVCAFMICIIVSYGTTVYFSPVGAVAWFVWLIIYFFL